MRYQLSAANGASLGRCCRTSRAATSEWTTGVLINGISWVLQSGAPWRDLPDSYGAPTTCYNASFAGGVLGLGSAHGCIDRRSLCGSAMSLWTAMVCRCSSASLVLAARQPARRHPATNDSAPFMRCLITPSHHHRRAPLIPMFQSRLLCVATAETPCTITPPNLPTAR